LESTHDSTVLWKMKDFSKSRNSQLHCKCGSRDSARWSHWFYRPL